MNILTTVKMITAVIGLTLMLTGYIAWNSYLGSFSAGVFLFAAISVTHDHTNDFTNRPII